MTAKNATTQHFNYSREQNVKLCLPAIYWSNVVKAESILEDGALQANDQFYLM